MTAPQPYAPLPANHPSVRDGTLCPCCEQPFAAGDVTCLWPVRGPGDAVWSAGESQDGGICREAALLHHACAVRVVAALFPPELSDLNRERLRSPNAPARDTARLDFLERRIRECGPDLGCLLGLPQGWTNLRAAVDQAQASLRP